MLGLHAKVFGSDRRRCRVGGKRGVGGGAEGAHLVCRIKEGQQTPLLHNLEDALPLVWGGVHPRGVVGTGMQQYHRALGGAAQVLTHTLHAKRNHGCHVAPS